jgi:hypothetical protein
MSESAAGISQAMRAQAPATLAQPGYQPGGILGGVPAPAMTAPQALLRGGVPYALPSAGILGSGG